MPKVTRSILCSLFLLAFLFGYSFPAFASAPMPAPNELLSVQVRYRGADASEVFFVWGTNGWKPIPEDLRPPGTVLKDKVLLTPMARAGDAFTTELAVTAGTTIDYGFLITRNRAGAEVNIWQVDGEQDFHTTVSQNNTLIEKTAPRILGGAPLLAREIRYQMAEAGEVFLVWGIDGWRLLPEAVRPSGTIVKRNVMQTRMARAGDSFVANVDVPAEALLDYGFLITKKRSGAEIVPVWEGYDSKRIVAGAENPISLKTALTLRQAKEMPTVLDIALCLLVGICVLLAMGAIVARIPLGNSSRAVTAALGAMVLVGFVLRLLVVNSTQRLLDTPAQLIGDEPRYDFIAYSLLQGAWFEWPASTPVYPLFLAANYLAFGYSYAPVLYAQALVGITTVPLTYRLARRFTGARGALLAAGLTALSPSLASHVGYLYTEVLYTPLFLATVLGLLWALEEGRPGRFVWAGLLLGVSTLCRPASALLPLVLPLMMPRGWSKRLRIALVIAYAVGTAAPILPWAVHNYRLHNTFLPFGLSLMTFWSGSPEFYHVMEQKPNAMVEIWNDELNPQRNGGYDPLTIEGDRYFNARALTSIRNEPGVFAWYFLQKLAYFWIGHPAARYDWPFDFDTLRQDFSPWEIAGLFGGRLLLLPATLWALIGLRKRLGLFGPVLVICAYFTLVYAILVPLARHSEPLYPILAVIVATAVAQVFRWSFRDDRHRSSQSSLLFTGEARRKPPVFQTPFERQKNKRARGTS